MKPHSAFYPRKGKPGGYCIPCTKAANREYELKAKERKYGKEKVNEIKNNMSLEELEDMCHKILKSLGQSKESYNGKIKSVETIQSVCASGTYRRSNWPLRQVIGGVHRVNCWNPQRVKAVGISSRATGCVKVPWKVQRLGL